LGGAGLVRLTTALLADFVDVRAGLLFVIGGGIGRIYVAGLPSQLPVGIGLILTIEAHEWSEGAPVEVPVKIKLRRDGRKVADIEAVIGGLPGVQTTTLMLPAAFDLRRIPIKELGAYRVWIRAGNATARLQFDVVLMESQESPPLA
jgi:hypothetical protein